MISKIERTIAFRYLKPKKKEGFLKVISIFSFTGIALGVAILIIVMSVMNGFRTELVSKILGFNPHIIIKPYDKEINNDDIEKLKDLNDIILRSSFTFSGQGILINKNNTTGILVRSYLKNEIEKVSLLKNSIIDGSLSEFSKDTISKVLELVFFKKILQAVPASIDCAYVAAQTHQESPSFKPGKLNSGCGVIKSLPASLDHSKNLLVTFAQTVCLP